MRRRILDAAGICLLLALCLAPRVTEASRHTVYLVTMYPGEALFTGFGHIAFRIVDAETGDDDVFDYGTYEYEDPLLPWKFLVGTLPYYCSHTTFQAMTTWYSQDFAGILVQQLDLTDEQTEKLVSKVNHDCLPENAAYAYHHFHNNCATKLRDILDELLEGELGRATKGKLAGRSLRDLIDASLAKWEFSVTRWLVFGLLNWEIDRPADRWQQMFLPWYLSKELDGLVQPARAGRPPLVVKRELVLGRESPAPPAPAPWFGVIFLVFLGILSLLPLAFSRSSERRGRKVAGTIVLATGTLGGFYGSLLAFSSAVSPYPETMTTLSLLCFHPLHLLLAAAGIAIIRNRRRWVRPTSYYFMAGALLSALFLALNIAGVIPQRIWHYALACLVLSAGLSFTLSVLRKREDRQ